MILMLSLKTMKFQLFIVFFYNMCVICLISYKQFYLYLFIIISMKTNEILLFVYIYIYIYIYMYTYIYICCDQVCLY